MNSKIDDQITRDQVAALFTKVDLSKMTTIGRPLDLKYVTNKLIVIIAFLTFAFVALFNVFHGETNYASLTNGIRTGLLVFLLWAISRELDPDKEWGAFVNVSLALVVIIFSGTSSILPFVWFLLILRIVNHSTGMPAGVIDSSLVSFIGIILSHYAFFIYGVLTATGFIIDSRLNDPAKHHLLLGTLTLIASALSFIEKGGVTFTYSLESVLLVVLGTLLFLPAIIRPEKLESIGDRTGKSLDPARIKSARIVAILFFCGTGILSGEVNQSLIIFTFCILAGNRIYRIAFSIWQNTCSNIKCI
ncbi:hypothetical protein [Methanolobus psychrotolerans]|uniref:hypothetical protein n=1 Tax=Methanolobus psychrotolerans TaxID=1874706 RepID=UPI000B9184D6|nr:hypothetical protein [Methanolobus psychrotolerans]